MSIPLYVQARWTDNLNGTYSLDHTGLPTDVLPFVFSFSRPSIIITLGTLDVIHNVFATPDDGLNYYFASEAAAVVAAANADAGFTRYSLAGRSQQPFGFTQWSLDAKVDVVSGKALSTNDYTSAEKTKLAGLSTPATLSFANPTRSLNTAYQISAARNAIVSYSVDVTATMSLTSGQTGTVVLEYADDSGITTNVVTVSDGLSGNTGTLTIGLGLTQLGTINVGGVVPAGKYARLRTVNTTGTPSFAFRRAQEVLM